MAKRKQPVQGEFPYPELEGSEESKYLTWLRNNSSYLKLGGLRGSLQAIAIYARGVFGILLILAPVLMLIGSALGLLHFLMLQNPFWLTKWLTAAAVLFTLGYFAIRSADSRFKPSRELAGALLGCLGFCFLLELSPHLIEFARDYPLFQSFGIKEFTSVVFGIASSAGLVLKYMPEAPSLRRQVSLLLLSLMSFILTWMVILRFASFVSYGIPPHDVQILFPVVMLCAFLFSLMLFVWKSPAFDEISDSNSASQNVAAEDSAKASPTDAGETTSSEDTGDVDGSSALALNWIRPLLLLLCGMLILACVFFRGTILTSMIVAKSEFAGEKIGTLTRPLKRVVVGLRDADESEISDALKTKIGKLGEAVNSLDQQGSFIESNKENRSRLFYRFALPGRDTGKQFEPEYVSNAAQFLESATWLGELSDADENMLLELLAKNARDLLAQESGRNNRSFAESFAIEVAQEFANSIMLERFRNQEEWGELSFDSKPPAVLLERIFPMEGDSSKDQNSQRGKSFADALNEARIPLSQAAQYLELTKRAAGELDEYRGKSAPDSALTGPRIWPDKVLIGGDLDGNVGRDNKTSKLRANAYWNAIASHPNSDLARKSLETIVANPWLTTNLSGNGKDAEFFMTVEVRALPFRSICSLALHGEPVRCSKTLLDGLGIQHSDIDSIAPVLIAQLGKKRKHDSTESKNGGLSNERFLKRIARKVLVDIALSTPDIRTSDDNRKTLKSHADRRQKARLLLADLFDPEIPVLDEIVADGREEAGKAQRLLYELSPGRSFEADELKTLLAKSFVFKNKFSSDRLIGRMVYANHAQLDGIDSLPARLYGYGKVSKGLLVVPIVVLLLLLCRVFIDANSTSLHEFYRNRLAFAFLTGPKEPSSVDLDVEPEADVKLSEFSDYEGGNSVAPYHLINAAINLQGSEDRTLRERKADFFLFSKLYVGGKRTGYLKTKEFETHTREFNAASAMAVSGAAASPNMGRYTNGLLTFLMTVLNVRLGYWIPNPKKIGECFEFREVRKAEFEQIQIRRKNVASTQSKDGIDRIQRTIEPTKLTVENQLLGIALSGGGIRSAAINLGMLQAIDSSGLFRDVDYLSTVSGGGYTGTAVSNFMREKACIGSKQQDSRQNSALSFLEQAKKNFAGLRPVSLRLWKRFVWMPSCWLLLAEMFGRINSERKWVNVSDGGHVENLGAYELMMRRCKIIIVGDGEADPNGVLDGLSRLMRLAEIDKSIKVEFINGGLDTFKKSDTKQGEKSTAVEPHHFAVAKISYPETDEAKAETGWLLYLKSSLKGDEDPVIENYRKMNPSFPHQTTADQLFDEGQFEAYRRLGNKMGTSTLASLSACTKENIDSFASLERGLIESGQNEASRN